MSVIVLFPTVSRSLCLIFAQSTTYYPYDHDSSMSSRWSNPTWYSNISHSQNEPYGSIYPSRCNLVPNRYISIRLVPRAFTIYAHPTTAANQNSALCAKVLVVKSLVTHISCSSCGLVTVLATMAMHISRGASPVVTQTSWMQKDVSKINCNPHTQVRNDQLSPCSFTHLPPTPAQPREAQISAEKCKNTKMFGAI